ncbi:MAG: efflux RND transporter periplasmic adaptor subunit [Candidatus Wallbacteria bacterium]|nr:efflux RND transporter periplasmic adaptor subunit [Candidatus Wallbacteria bacterium]
MSGEHVNKTNFPSWAKPAAGIAGVLLLIVFQSGKLSCGRIDPGQSAVTTPLKPGTYSTAVAEIIETDRIYEESGVVTTWQKAEISPQIMGAIKEIFVSPGDHVEQGKLLARIDSEQLNSRLWQARNGLKQAQAAKIQAEHDLESSRAALEQAEKNYGRIKELFDKKAAPEALLEDAESKRKQAVAAAKGLEEGINAAKAEIEKAMKAVKEAEISCSYAEILAPFPGTVTRKLADSGDLAVPGKPILILHNPTTMLLEAHLRENFKNLIRQGMDIGLEIGGMRCTGQVAEIIPNVDPTTRTFVIKASFTSEEQVFVGMYGKMLIPAGKESVVTIPEAGISHVGQLATVLVMEGDTVRRRYVRLGQILDQGMVEILSGLTGGETVMISGGEK